MDKQQRIDAFRAEEEALCAKEAAIEALIVELKAERQELRAKLGLPPLFDVPLRFVKDDE